MDIKRIPKQGTAMLTKGRRNVRHLRRTNFTLRVMEQALRPTPSEFLMMMVMMIMMMIVRLGIRT
jgi:hypothetical protein